MSDPAYFANELHHTQLRHWNRDPCGLRPDEKVGVSAVFRRMWNIGIEALRQLSLLSLPFPSRVLQNDQDQGVPSCYVPCGSLLFLENSNPKRLDQKLVLVLGPILLIPDLAIEVSHSVVSRCHHPWWLGWNFGFVPFWLASGWFFDLVPKNGSCQLRGSRISDSLQSWQS